MSAEAGTRNWKEIKAGLQREWGMFSDEDWKHTKGHEDAIVELLSERYGSDKDVLEQKVGEIFAEHTTFRDAETETEKSTFRNKPYISEKTFSSNR